MENYNPVTQEELFFLYKHPDTHHDVKIYDIVRRLYHYGITSDILKIPTLQELKK